MKHAIGKASKTLRTVLNNVRWSVRDRARHLSARLNRKRLADVTFIGITGSAGKTTTKELTASILAIVATCHKSIASRNDHSAVDATVQAATRDHRFCVVEAGAVAPGYLDRSIRVIQPRIAVLTLIAREHYSAFRSLEAIAEEKGKLVTTLPPDGIAVLNIDDPYIRSIGERWSGTTVWVGKDEKATLRLIDAKSQWPEPLCLHVRYQDKVTEIRTRLHGTHLALSALCALGASVAAGFTLERAAAALEELEPTEGRMQVERTGDGVVFVRDDWKSPSWSLQAPFDFMRDARAQRKVIVLGSISDSPKSPSRRYAQASRDAMKVADLVVMVGTDALRAVKPSDAYANGRLRAFASVKDAAEFLRPELRAGDLVLLKGVNLQDHLVRILLDRNRPVGCWQADCGRQMFCGSCPKLHLAVAGVPDAGGASRHAASPGLATASSLARRPQGAMLLIVGLGNPGKQYADTPHNAGHSFVDQLVRAQGREWEQQAEGFVSSVEIEGLPVALLKPGAEMNLAGEPVQHFLARTDRRASDCILVHDDMDIELGVVRSKIDGGDGGHKGVRSIIAALGTDSVKRIRIGVRPPGKAERAKKLVLAGFSGPERALLAQGLEQAASAIRAMINPARVP